MNRSQAFSSAVIDDIHRFISEVWQVCGASSEMHIGDFYWSLFHRASTDRTASVSLWYDDADILQGIGLFPGTTWCDMVVRPVHLASSLSEDMIAWAIRECRRKHPYAKAPLLLRLGRRVTAPERLELLARLGFRQMDFGYLSLTIAVHPQKQRGSLPNGFVCRPLNEHDIQSRVAAHNSAFPGEEMSVTDYSCLMACPGYERTLDLVVVNPSGAIASFCTLWLDEINCAGLLEPVGCHPQYRRQGLTRYVIIEGLQRLWERGATEAIVRAHSDNVAAVSLHKSCGFTVASTTFGHEKEIR
jgi:GNAT superfamily N-acetyltransferase